MEHVVMWMVLSRGAQAALQQIKLLLCQKQTVGGESGSREPHLEFPDVPGRGVEAWTRLVAVEVMACGLILDIYVYTICVYTYM